MKILFDECVRWPARKILAGHQCTSVQQRGWSGFRNGQLLALAEGNFDLFLTSDQSIEYQQNLAGRQIAILQLSTNNLRKIVASSQLLQTEVNAIQPCECRRPQIP